MKSFEKIDTMDSGAVWKEFNGNIYINLYLTEQKENTATNACKAQGPTNKRQKVFIHGQKQCQGPPFYIKF